MYQTKEVSWVGNSLENLKKLPDFVRQEIGFTLYEIQIGNHPTNIKALQGLGAGVMEIISDFDKNTYRAVYALKLGEKIYVLHVFQKKSKQGKKTPKQDMDLIKRRLLYVKQQQLKK